MRVKLPCLLALALAFSASSCSIDISQAARPAATAAPAEWSTLGLTGTLVYQKSIQSGSSLSMSIETLDLATGQVATVFQAPSAGWINSMSVSPDRRVLVMAYVPPPVDNSSTGGVQQALYVLPLDGSSLPQLLFTPRLGDDQYLEPAWSPDGKFLYFCRLDPSTSNLLLGRSGTYQVYRMAYPGGEPQKIIDKAYWPHLSRDGARLAYVTTDPTDQSNKLFVSNPDGTGAARVNLTGGHIPSILDAPIFAADGRSILFSATVPTWPAQPSWADRLFGITVASAHTIPSDWWSVPTGGGEPTRLTHLAARGLYGSLSPDGNLMASYSNSGIFVMDLDGTGLTVVTTANGNLPGTLDWIP